VVDPLSCTEISLPDQTNMSKILKAINVLGGIELRYKNFFSLATMKKYE
jgi:hypothetical protein